MNRKSIDRSHCLSFIGLVFLIMLAFASTDDDFSDTSKTKESKKVVPEMTEDEYLKYFQTKWDSVALNANFYKTYKLELRNIIQEMLVVLEQKKISILDSTSKLNMLHFKLMNSKKNRDAIEKFEKYGQPERFELESACKFYIRQFAHDPSSIEIADFWVQGQSDFGWIVGVRYRGRNAFGGMVLNSAKFDVRYSNGYYEVYNMYNY